MNSIKINQYYLPKPEYSEVFNPCKILGVIFNQSTSNVYSKTDLEAKIYVEESNGNTNQFFASIFLNAFEEMK